MPDDTAKPLPILLIGAGRMGAALLDGWLGFSAEPPLVFSVLDPHPSDALRAQAEAGMINLNPDLERILAAPPVLTVLAVKPQIMDEVLAPLRALAQTETVFLSVAAGRSMATIHKAFGAEVKTVRAMPNTPASVGRGATVCVAGDGVSEAIKDLCTRLLEAVGAVYWLEDEGLIDAVTALSGSGPAYVFHLTEAMAAAGARLGLPDVVARDLARLTVAGAGEMLWRGEADAATLRTQVTSPGGTTAAALDVLMAREGLGALVERAMTAARDRGRVLDQS